MWGRLRRRSLAPRRPAVFPEQWGLLLVTVLALGAGVWFVASRVIFG
jgi:hypothetical protein